MRDFTSEDTRTFGGLGAWVDLYDYGTQRWVGFPWRELAVVADVFAPMS